jgi:histidine ammonia-lyase
MSIIIGDRVLAFAELLAFADFETKIEISPKARQRIISSRAIANENIDSGKAVYGLNTGLGAKVSMPLERESVAAFELSVLSGRIIGIGEPLAIAVCRRALALRIVNICHGYSAISMHVVDQLVAMYNGSVTPVVASYGSVGSSDLGQCAQLCAAAIGVGEVWVEGVRVSATEGLRQIGLEPVELAAKDALGLLNSGAVTQAIAMHIVYDLEVLLNAAVQVSVASCEAFGVNPAPFTDAVVATRQIPGGKVAGEKIMGLLLGSWTLEAGAISQAQHALSFRTLVPLIALLSDYLRQFSELIVSESNTSNDNPVVVAQVRELRSSSNFQPLAASVAGDALAIAITHWSNASANRSLRMVNASIEGVPRYLAPAEGHSVGFNALMKSTVAMAARVRFEASPAGLDFFALSENAEDVATQLPLVVEKLARQSAWLRKLVSIEALTAFQLLCLQPDKRRGRAAKHIFEQCSRIIPMIKHDQPLGQFVDSIESSIYKGEFR